MKVGVLTFHNAYNYGAILQAYATQKLLENRGHDVEFIDYRNDAIDKSYKKFHFSWKNNPLRIIDKLLRSRYQLKKEKKFDSFKKNHMVISSITYHKGEPVNAGIYDLVLIGSDQVWNPKLTGGLDDVYWGNLEVSDKTKIISWAASSMYLSYSSSELSFIKESLLKFAYISVREEALKKIVQGLTTQNVFKVVDPTFLLPMKQWAQLCHPVEEKNFVTVYAVRNRSETIRLAEKIANKMKKKLIVLRAHVQPIPQKNNKYTCGIEDFLSYIYSADFVVASSFHGTVFSIIFEKLFVNYTPSNTNDSRMTTILKALGLKDRVVSDNSSLDVITKQIDYSSVKRKLITMCEESIQFLDMVVKQ